MTDFEKHVYVFSNIALVVRYVNTIVKWNMLVLRGTRKFVKWYARF